MESSRGFCAIGAIRKAGDGDINHPQPLRDIVCDGIANVDFWNDQPSRTKEDVLASMDAAFVLALQEEGADLDEVFA